eukprot:jgi/Mesvir1/27765/Mv07450-RA.1
MHYTTLGNFQRQFFCGARQHLSLQYFIRSISGMPTSVLPEKRAEEAVASSSVHQVALEGYQQPAAYERGRPGYSTESVQKLLSQLLPRRPSSSDMLLELGSGSGKFTIGLIQLLDPLPHGPRVLCVDPVPGMRDALARSCGDRVDVSDGSAERIPADDGSVSAIFVAQAFHWFASEATLREMHRVLRPGGGVGLIWNTFDCTKDWVARLEAIRTRHYNHDIPRQQTGEWRRVFETAIGQSLFSPLDFWQGRFVQRGDASIMVDRIVSSSAVAVLPKEQQRAVADEVAAVMSCHPDVAGAVEYDLPYVTDVFWCFKV